MTSERNTLPGRPSNKLVADVRRILFWHFHSRPGKSQDDSWRDAWRWADAIRHRNNLYNMTKRPAAWPLPSEIATLYVLLCTVSMMESRMLGLYRAEKCIPDYLADRFKQFGGFESFASEIEKRKTISAKFTRDQLGIVGVADVIVGSVDVLYEASASEGPMGVQVPSGDLASH